MALSFKIPKKKQPEGSDSTHIHLQSPLSRLHGSAPQVKGFGSTTRSGADRMHTGKAAGIRATYRTPFRSCVQTLLGLHSPGKGGASSANQGSAGSWSSQWQRGKRAEVSSNGWRPKRASDRLVQPEDTSDLQPPPQKKGLPAGLSSLDKTISVESRDSLGELRAEEHAGKLSSSPLQGKVDPSVNSKEKNSSSLGPEETSQDQFKSSRRSSSSSMMKTALSPKKAPSRTQRMDLETQRERWRRFRDRKTPLAVVHQRRKKSRVAPSEPIVLSSEEEQDDGQTSRQLDGAGHSGKMQVLQLLGSAPPSFLQLEFCSVHFGLMEADAGGAMTVQYQS